MGKSTEQIVGTALGAVVGAFFGSPLTGAQVGYSIGTAFTEVDLPPGPRVENREFNDADYGSTIPLLFGQDVVPVSIAWMQGNKYIEQSSRNEVSKNQYQTSYTYKATVLLDLGEAEFETIDKVWCNNVLYYDRSQPNLIADKESEDEFKITLHRGEVDALPAEAIVAEQSTNAIPFRNRSTLMIENMNLSESFFNTLPTFRVLATRRSIDYVPGSSATVVDAEKLFPGGQSIATIFLQVPDSYKYDPSYAGNTVYDFLPASPNYSSDNGMYGVHHVEGTRIWASSYHNSKPWESVKIPSSSVKEVRYLFSNQVSAVIPGTKTFLAYRISRQEYDIDAISRVDVGSASGLPPRVERETWLYPFDLPVDGDKALYDVGGSFTARKFNVFIKAIRNTQDLYFIRYAVGNTFNVRFAIGKAIGDRMSVVCLNGFNPADYQLSTDAATYDTGSIINNGKALKCEKYFDKIYIWIGSANSGGSPPNEGFVGTIAIDANIRFPRPIEFYKKKGLFDWRTFFYYRSDENYVVSGIPRNFSDSYKVLGRTFNRLIPDYENERLYAYVNGGYDEADTNMTAEFPEMSGVAANGFYEIDRGDFSTIASYGTITPEGEDYDGNGFVSGGKYVIFPGRMIEIDRDTTSVVQTTSSIADVLDTLPSTGYESLEVVAYPQYKAGVFTDALIATGGALTLLFDSTISQDIRTAVEQHRYYHGPNTVAIKAGTTTTLDEVVSTLCQRTGVLTASDIDVTDLSGITVNGMVVAEQAPAINSIMALAKVYLFDMIEEDYKIKFVLRENASITRSIPAADLQAHEVGQKPFEIQTTTPANYKSPSVFSATFRDIESDYQPGTVQIESPFGENSARVDMQFPVALTTGEAYTALERISRATHNAEQGDISFQTTFKHSDLEVGQFVTATAEDGTSYTGRIVNKEAGRPGIVKFTIRPDILENYGAASIAYTGLSTTTVNPSFSSVVPIIVDSLGFTASEDGPGFWIGAYTAGDQDPGGVGIQVSYDDGNTFLDLVNRRANVLACRCVDALGDGEPGFVDGRESMTIHVLDGTPVTVTRAQLLSDQETNTFFYGAPGRWEMVKIQTFTDNGDGTYEATDFLRGYKGTDHFMGQHEIGDMLIKFDRSLMVRYIPPADRFEETALIRMAGYGNSGLRDVVDTYAPVTGNGALPLPPTAVTGYKADNGDWVLSWNRKARYGIEWKNRFDVIQDDSIEEYLIYILDTSADNIVLRTITVTNDTTYTYTDALQVTDFGATQGTLEFAIAKNSALYGAGDITRVSL